MLYQDQRSLACWYQRRFLKSFYHIFTIWWPWPGPFEQNFILTTHKSSTWNFASLGQVALQQKMFESINLSDLGITSKNDLDLWYSYVFMFLRSTYLVNYLYQTTTVSYQALLQPPPPFQHTLHKKQLKCVWLQFQSTVVMKVWKLIVSAKPQRPFATKILQETQELKSFVDTLRDYLR